MQIFKEGAKVQLNGGNGRVGVITGVYPDRWTRNSEADIWWARVEWPDDKPYPTSKHTHAELRHADALRNHCNPWTQAADETLMREVRKGQRHLGTLAFMHGRTEVAISSRLYKLCEKEAEKRGEFAPVMARYSPHRPLFDYIRDQRSGFTRRAVRALWSDPGYVERQTAYKQGFTAAQLQAASTVAAKHFLGEPDGPEMTEIKKLVGELAPTNKRQDVVGLLRTFGADRCSAVQPKYYNQVLNALRGMLPKLITLPNVKLSFTQMVPPCTDFAGTEARVLAGMGVPPVDAITKDGMGIDFKYTPDPYWAVNAQQYAYQQAVVHAMIHGTGRIKLFAADPVSTTKEEKPNMHKFYQVATRFNEQLTKEQAQAKAEKLAREQPTETFYITEAVQAVSLIQPKVAVTTLKAPKVVRAKRKAKRSK